MAELCFAFLQHAREEEIAERKAMKRAERDIARKKEFVRRVRLQIEDKRAEVTYQSYLALHCHACFNVKCMDQSYTLQSSCTCPCYRPLCMKACRHIVLLQGLLADQNTYCQSSLQIKTEMQTLLAGLQDEQHCPLKS